MILICKHCPSMKVVPPYRSTGRSSWCCPRCREDKLEEMRLFQEKRKSLADIFGHNETEGR